MKTLTEADVVPLANQHLKKLHGWRASFVNFANAILAKYGTQPDERAIIERERAAWDAACSFCLSSTSCHFVSSSTTQTERDRRYPLPKPEPQPVLTDAEIHQQWHGYSPLEIGRNIERAVLAKLAEQKP